MSRPQPMERTRTTAAVVAALADAGIRHVVGMPGGLTLRLWAALHDHPLIRAVQVREESLGAYMAEAHGRLTGRPIVLMGQGEWIVGNAGQGSLEALLGSSPMIVLTEMSDGGAASHHSPYQTGSGDYGAWDARGALAAVTKRVMVSHYPGQAVQHVQLAVRHAMTGQPGPVAVIFRGESLRGEVGPATRPTVYANASRSDPRRSGPTASEVSKTLDVLSQAARPVILAGNGVRVAQATDDLARFANAVDAVIVATPGGKGVADERAPRYAGVIGPFGWPEANALLRDADMILAVGTRLSVSDLDVGGRSLIDPQHQRLVHIDIEPLNLDWTMPADIAVVADATHALRALTAAAMSTVARIERRAVERVRAARAALGSGGEDDRAPVDGSPAPPSQTIRALARHLPDDVIVACDAGENRLFMMRWFQSTGGGRYLQPAAGGGMGYAVPAALGAKLARPQSSVVAVCGDGGFSMTMHGLLTAIEQDLPIAVVVLNNSALGWVLHGMGDHPVAARFNDVDYADIARAMGCDGVRVERDGDLEAALGRVATLRRPMVIDVPTSLDVSFRDLLDEAGTERTATGY